jgi:hypothetical protein
MRCRELVGWGILTPPRTAGDSRPYPRKLHFRTAFRSVFGVFQQGGDLPVGRSFTSGDFFRRFEFRDFLF